MLYIESQYIYRNNLYFSMLKLKNKMAYRACQYSTIHFVNVTLYGELMLFRTDLYDTIVISKWPPQQNGGWHIFIKST